MRKVPRRAIVALSVMVALALVLILFIHHERYDYTVPTAWSPIFDGTIRDRKQIIAVMRSNPSWQYIDMVSEKNYDLVASDYSSDRFVELLVYYDGTTSHRVELLCMCRSFGPFNRMDVHEFAGVPVSR